MQLFSHFKNILIARTHHTKICPAPSIHNLCEMKLNESLYQLLVPFWNKDQTNEKMKSVVLYIHSSFHMYSMKTADLEYLDDVTWDVWGRNGPRSSNITRLY